MTTYSEMSTQIKGGMDKHYNEEVKNMKQFFSNSKKHNKRRATEDAARITATQY